MALEDELKAQTMALVSQNMATWVVEIQRHITDHQAALVRALDELQESVARYDEKIDEAAIGAALSAVVAANPVAPPAPAAPAPPTGPGVTELVQSMIEVDMGTNLTEVLTNLVNESAKRVDRVAMFIVKGTNAVGWYARGFETSDGVKQIQVPLTNETIFKTLTTAKQTQVFSLASSPGTAQSLSRLGRLGTMGMAVPLVLREKLAAVLYCDAPGPIDDARVAFVDALVRFAAKTTDLISFAPKTPGYKPTLAPPLSGVTASPGPPPLDEPSTILFAPPAAPAPPKPVPPAPASGGDGGGTVMFTPAQAAAMKAATSAPMPAPAPPPPPAKPADGAGTVMFTPAQMDQMRQQLSQVQAKPSAPAAPALSPEEQKAHDDAKRFARLIVSEIKLYNESKVTEGRKARDIYERLKEDIERGRQMYHDRITPALRSSTNYFHDELVRLLAGGDAGALGRM